MPAKRVVVVWDWGATGIWSVRDPDEQRTPIPGGAWLPYTPPVDKDRHRAWRGLLSDDLIDALQAWNDRGDLFMGRQAHQHTDQERADYWAVGERLAKQAQQELGTDYDVSCRTPASFRSR